METLRVLSYNIHKGYNTSNRKFVLDRIRNAIRSVQPDLVFLQEVLGHPSQPQFEFLAQEIWPHFAYGKNAVHARGHHGNAILSKYPILSWENIDVSIGKMERRGILHGVIRVPGVKTPVHALCVHLGLFETDRRAQTIRLCERIDSHISKDETLIIAGDFNDWRERVSHVLAKKLRVREAFRVLHKRHAKTFPSWMPALRLDRIYFRGASAKVAQCLAGQPWNELSDHSAVYTELRLSRSTPTRHLRD